METVVSERDAKAQDVVRRRALCLVNLQSAPRNHQSIDLAVPHFPVSDQFEAICKEVLKHQMLLLFGRT